MDDAGAMRDIERARHLSCDIERFDRRDGALAHPLAQGDAFDEFGRDVVSGIRLADLVDGHDIRMIQSRRGAGFALQTFQFGGIRRGSHGEELKCDLSPQPLVAGAIDYAHPADTGDRVQPIGAELLADQGLRIGYAKSGRDRKGRRSDKVAGVIVTLEEQLDPAPQRLVAVTAPLEDGGAFARRLLHRPVEDFGATLPALRVHPSLPRSAPRRARPAPPSNLAPPC